jgi:hypothetical protein
MGTRASGNIISVRMEGDRRHDQLKERTARFGLYARLAIEFRKHRLLVSQLQLNVEGFTEFAPKPVYGSVPTVDDFVAVRASKINRESECVGNSFNIKRLRSTKFSRVQQLPESGSGPGGRRFKSSLPDHFFSRSFNRLRCYHRFTVFGTFRYARYNGGQLDAETALFCPLSAEGKVLLDFVVGGTHVLSRMSRPLLVKAFWIGGIVPQVATSLFAALAFSTLP